MFRTLRNIMVVVLAALYLTSAMALAASGTLSGTVQHVAPQQGRLMLSSEEGKTVELYAPAELLTGLQNGDAVEVQVSGQNATFIRRQGGVQRPDMGGALQFQQPEGGPSHRNPGAVVQGLWRACGSLSSCEG